MAKLYGAFPVPHLRKNDALLPVVLGRCEPREERARKRFHQRFGALLQSPLFGLEPHLRWALSVVADAVAAARARGVDWAQLLDDLSIWDRGDEHRRRCDVGEIWAEKYLNAVNQTEGRN